MIVSILYISLCLILLLSPPLPPLPHTLLLSLLELRPHQPKDQKLVAECGRIRDMANVSTGYTEAPISVVTVCNLILQKVLDLLYSEVPELRRPVPSFDSPSTGYSSHCFFINVVMIEIHQMRISAQTQMALGPGLSDLATLVLLLNHLQVSVLISCIDSHSYDPTIADKLKALFGSTGKTNTVVYDPNYATMDPVPHNTTSSSPFLVHVPQSVSSTHYQGEAGRPSGVGKYIIFRNSVS